MRSLIPVLLSSLFALLLTGCGDDVRDPAPKSGDGMAPGAGAGSGAETPVSAELADEELMAEPKKLKEKPSQSGVLTAGSFDDNRHPSSFRKFVSALAQHRGAGNLAGRLQGHRVTITVKDARYRPLGNAKVTVGDPQQQASVTLTTKSDGRVVFLSSWDRATAQNGLQVRVAPADGSPPITQTVPAGQTSHEVVVPSATASLPKRLDLALVIDTTGSMSDELNYLKTEIKGISQAIKDRFPEVDQRFSLIVYRDHRDEYVTRKFDFTPSLDVLHRNLSAQSASGGGDYPEAMDAALEDALQLRWRTDSMARVLFLLADAPPHTQQVERTFKAVDQLRRLGIAIYPIAASGADAKTELVMRTSALLTGSQYLFLTDDSGVGNSHAEPHIPFYHVQRLDHLMIRMVAGELSGKRIEPQPSEIIRTVGKPLQ